MFQNEDRLATIIELRKVNKFKDKIEEHSWSEIIEVVRRITEKSEAVVGWGIPLRKGIIRDIIIEVLELGIYSGLDVDFLSIFNDLKGESIVELQNAAKEIAFKALVKQIKDGNTYFLNTDTLSDSDLVVIVPQILEVRKSQILELDATPTLGQVYSTFYGYELVTQGGVGFERAGIQDVVKPKFEELALQLGRRIEIQGDPQDIVSLRFENTTAYTEGLLSQLYVLSTGSYQDQIGAATELARIADSRALYYLHSKLSHLSDRAARHAIISALGLIGHPDSFEILRNILTDNERPSYFRMDQDHRIASIALGGIRHHMAEHQIREAAKDISYPIEAFGLTRNPEFTKMIEDRIHESKSRHTSDIFRHLEALKNTGPIGANLVRRKYIAMILEDRRYVASAINLIGSISYHSWNEPQVELIVKSLTLDSGTEGIIQAISEDEQLLNNQRIRAAIKKLRVEMQDTPSDNRLRRVIERIGI